MHLSSQIWLSFCRSTLTCFWVAKLPCGEKASTRTTSMLLSGVALQLEQRDSGLLLLSPTSRVLRPA